MKTKSAVALIVAVLAGGARAQQPNTIQVKPAGESILNATHNGKPLTISISTSRLDIGTTGHLVHTPETLRCTYSHVPCSLLDTLTITLDGHAVEVPRSLQSTLSDLSTASLRPGPAMLLVLTGGDASEAYIAKIHFNGKQVVEVDRYDAEDRSHPVEVTKYFPTTFR